ncbi:MAG: ECF transporter S component [Candidatus Bathyarchaeia archaeon]
MAGTTLNVLPSLSTRQVSVIAVMTSLCVSTNYLLVGVVNVKFMDLLVFVSGFAFGPVVGGAVGVLTWLVYGTLNPYGFSLPILAATCLGESIYGVVGGLLGGMADGADGGVAGRFGFLDVRFAIVGFLLTSVYDLLTNVVSGFFAGMPIHVALVAGIPFALTHELSNTAFFFVGVSPLVNVIRRLPSGEWSRR